MRTAAVRGISVDIRRKSCYLVPDMDVTWKPKPDQVKETLNGGWVRKAANYFVERRTGVARVWAARFGAAIQRLFGIEARRVRLCTKIIARICLTGQRVRSANRVEVEVTGVEWDQAVRRCGE